jgi:hypothetical protein
MSKLKFFIKDKIKVYTLKDSINNIPTKDAHYKYLKLRDAPPSNVNIVRKN